MTRLIYAMIPALLLATVACGDTNDTTDDTLSKETARTRALNGDDTDFCEEEGWYNDGICDDFCIAPDPDCDEPDPDPQPEPNPEPQACIEIYAPVCGVDGETYSNDCFAEVAGVEIAHEGECDGIDPIPTDCMNDSQCGEAQYCAFGTGECGDANVLGTCVDRPEACDLDYSPVCGCDGNTHSNACAAASAGVNVLYDGECDGGDPDPNACGGIQGLGCDEGDYCHFEVEAMCGGADQLGECRERPDACIEIYAPVCGCDGQTYSNDCHAAGAGVSVLSEGECDGGDPQGCVSNDDCDRGDYCARDAGACGDPNALGTCEVRPEACIQVYDPVCGCDGQTHGNACDAASRGINVDYSGECE